MAILFGYCEAEEKGGQKKKRKKNAKPLYTLPGLWGVKGEMKREKGGKGEKGRGGEWRECFPPHFSSIKSEKRRGKMQKERKQGIPFPNPVLQYGDVEIKGGARRGKGREGKEKP